MTSSNGDYEDSKPESDGDTAAEEDIFEYRLEGIENELSPADGQKKHDEIIEAATDAGKTSFLDNYEQFFRTNGTEGYSILHNLVRKVDDESYKQYVPLFETLFRTVPDLALRKDEEDKTALHIVVQQENNELATYLCNHLDCEWLGIPNKTGDTCLHIAIRKSLPCAEQMIEKLATKGDDFARKVLSMKGEGGNTPLHIAVEYERCKDNHVKLVRRLLEVSDEALGLENDGGILGKSVQTKLSPLRYHQRTADLKRYHRTTERKEGSGQSRKPSMPAGQKRRVSDQQLQNRAKSPIAKTVEIKRKQWSEPKVAKEIEDLLLQHCMRTRTREDAIRILHGTIQHRQIDFDLVSKSVISVEDLKGYAAHLQFEPVLQYVMIPKLRVEDFNKEKWKDKPFLNARGRTDYLVIFDWLREKGVERILRAIVVDDDEKPHSDEAIIAALQEFRVESWDWRKFDLCSDVISRAAGKSVREVKLYCGGNNAILRSWSSESGLAKLPELRKLEVEMHKGFESHEATRENVKSFKKELENSYTVARSDAQWPSSTARESPTKLDVICKIVPPEGAQKRHSANRRKEKQWEQRERWMECMRNFADFIRNYPMTQSCSPIKVGLIDDGVDGTFRDLNRSIVQGQSFSSRGSDLCNPYYISSRGHGTVMAFLIRQMCPNVQLYVAKLDERTADSGPQITTSSAAKAINWAREMGVHIISMSWTIESPEEDDRKSLQNAINEATSRGILLFCASDDQGNTKTRETYPARCNNKIFRIGAATHLGAKGEAVRSESVDYIFPGEKHLIPPLPEQIPEEGQWTASSLATALASGLAALILHCAVLRAQKDFNKLWSYDAMKSAFRAIDVNHQYLHVWNVFKEYLDKIKVEGHEESKEVLNQVVDHLLRT